MRFLLMLSLVFAVGCSTTNVSPLSPTAIAPTATASAIPVAPASSPNGTPPTVCWAHPPFGGNDSEPPIGGCYASGLSRAEIDALIAKYPQGTWGLSGHGRAFAEQLPDGTWHVAVNR